ncbi:MAG: TolC family protein [Desulfotalea sp.]
MRLYLKALASLVLCFSLSSCGDKIASHDEAVSSIKTSPTALELQSKDWVEKAAKEGLVDDGWIKSFGDEKLDSLVQEAQENNFDLKIAAAQVESASALAKKAGAALKPTIGLSGGYYDSANDDRSENYGGGLNITWEPDIWGKIKNRVTASEETFAAVQSDYQFARQSLAATTANAWFITASSKVLLNFAEDIVKLFSETLRIAEAKEKVGRGNMKDVFLAKANLAKAQEASRGAKSAYNNSRRSLEVLLGRYPGAEIETLDKLIAVPPPIAVGIPSALLERRPDLLAAEQRVAVAFYQQKEAELLHLPDFSFDVTVGSTSAEDLATSLVAGFFVPLYTGGAIEAEVEKATADQKATIAAYGQKLLVALEEVEGALAAERDLLAREQYMTSVVEENYKAYRITQKQYDIGKIEFLDVIYIQGKWIEAKIALTDLATKRLLNRVNLHLALGGSFEENSSQDG